MGLRENEGERSIDLLGLNSQTTCTLPLYGSLTHTETRRNFLLTVSGIS